MTTQIEKATFAGGCFWCMEPPFEKLNGVISVTSGYVGGAVENPTYQQVSAGGTGHAEAVQIVYDSSKTSYQQLLDVFWKNVDPLVKDRQFCDVGNQYRSAIFPENAEQKSLAEKSLKDIQTQLGHTVFTQIEPTAPFYPAEDYHQDYYKKNPIRYKFYRSRCGRDKRLKQVWG